MLICTSISLGCDIRLNLTRKWLLTARINSASILCRCHCVARACKTDVNKYCKDEKKEAKKLREPALVLACLKCASYILCALRVATLSQAYHMASTEGIQHHQRTA